MGDGDLLELVDSHADQDDPGREETDAARETVPPITSRSRSRTYEAYKTKAKAPRLKIRVAGRGKTSILYSNLGLVRANEAETELELISRFLIVRIRGKNMGGIIEAIDNHACDFIQEYNPLIFARPDREEPIIEMMEFPGEDEDSEDNGEMKALEK